MNLELLVEAGGLDEVALQSVRQTLEACREYGCVYFHAVGGAAQVLAERIKRVRNVYFLKEFGSPEAIWEFEVERFPAFVTMDSHGGSLHNQIFASSQAELEKRI